MLKRKSQLMKLLVASLAALSLGQALAEEDYSAEGERRAKLAGKGLLGTTAPQLLIKTLDGKTIDLSQLYGHKPVYIKYWATWCAPCRKQMPGFEALYQKYGEQIQVIAVNTGLSDDLKSVSAFKDKAGLSMPIAIDDGTLARALNFRVTPQHLLINKRGEFAYVGHEDDGNFYRALEQVIAEEAPEVAPTASVIATQIKGYDIGDKLAPISLKSIANQGFSVPAGNSVGAPATNSASLPSTSSDAKETVLVFFAPWCEWYLEQTEPLTSKSCTLVRQMLESHGTDRPDDSDTQWLSVSTNLWTSKEDLTEYQASHGAVGPIIFDADGELFARFGVTQVPTVITVDQAGRVTDKVDFRQRGFKEKVTALFSKASFSKP
ncbi:redoxin domain-containing protein [Shewanella cyperi]|nr:redoxin domain-containing protein [Shewanella cyperi]